MPTITELPSDAVEPLEPTNDDPSDSDRLLQPAENVWWHYDWWTDDTPAAPNPTIQRDAGREVLEARIANEREQYQTPANSTIQRDAGREVLEARIANEREQYQPSAAEKIFAIIKSMLLRGMVIYFLMHFFRRPQPNQQPSAPEAD